MSAWLDPATRRTFAGPGGGESVADDWIEARGFRAAPHVTNSGYDPPLPISAYVAGCLVIVMAIGFLLGALTAWLWG